MTVQRDDFKHALTGEDLYRRTVGVILSGCLDERLLQYFLLSHMVDSLSS